MKSSAGPTKIHGRSFAAAEPGSRLASPLAPMNRPAEAAMEMTTPVRAIIRAESDSESMNQNAAAMPNSTADSTSCWDASALDRSEEHTSELQSLMRISYAVFCLKKKTSARPQCTRHHIPPHPSKP